MRADIIGVVTNTTLTSIQYYSEPVSTGMLVYVIQALIACCSKVILMSRFTHSAENNALLKQ